MIKINEYTITGIARMIFCSYQCVRNWLYRFEWYRLEGLEDLFRSGLHVFHQLVRPCPMSFVFGVWTLYLIESYQIHSLQWVKSVLVYHLQARDICTPWSDQYQTMTASCLVFILFLINSINSVCSGASKHPFPASDSRSLDSISNNGILSLLSSINSLKCANIQENFSI